MNTLHWVRSAIKVGLSTFALVLALLIPLAAQTVPQRSDEIVGTGEDFLSYCKSRSFDPNPSDVKLSEAVAGMRCVTYLAGVVKGMLSIQTTTEYFRGTSNVICFPPEGISSEQTRRIVVKWLEDHPERLHMQAGALVFFALLDTFPCAVVPEKQNNSASLKETLEWLRAKIPLGTVRHSYAFVLPQGKRGPTVWFTQQSKVYILDSCTAIIGLDGTTDADGGSVTNTIRYTLPIGIVNGGFVKQGVTEPSDYARFLSGDRFQYVLTLTATSKGILVDSYTASVRRSSSQMADQAQLLFADDSLAQRVLEAFRHAADLCRNKEPF
jgi:hypothetical protein